MDSFDEKRGMVKKLLDMLKSSAAGEVGNGLVKPEGEGDMHGVEVERVEVLPEHKMDESTPEHDVTTKMADGGVVPDAEEGQPDKMGAVEGNLPPSDEKADEEDESTSEYDDTDDEQPSMFQSFLSRKKRK